MALSLYLSKRSLLVFPDELEAMVDACKRRQAKAWKKLLDKGADHMGKEDWALLESESKQAQERFKNSRLEISPPAPTSITHSRAVRRIADYLDIEGSILTKVQMTEAVAMCKATEANAWAALESMDPESADEILTAWHPF